MLRIMCFFIIFIGFGICNEIICENVKSVDERLYNSEIYMRINFSVDSPERDLRRAWLDFCDALEEDGIKITEELKTFKIIENKKKILLIEINVNMLQVTGFQVFEMCEKIKGCFDKYKGEMALLRLKFLWGKDK